MITDCFFCLWIAPARQLFICHCAVPTPNPVPAPTPPIGHIPAPLFPTPPETCTPLNIPLVSTPPSRPSRLHSQRPRGHTHDGSFPFHPPATPYPCIFRTSQKIYISSSTQRAIRPHHPSFFARPACHRTLLNGLKIMQAPEIIMSRHFPVSPPLPPHSPCL